MGTEVSLRDQGYLISGNTDISKVFEENFKGIEITPDLLEKVKNPSGGSTSFEIDTLEGEESVKSIVGIIINHKSQRAYWEVDFNQGGGGTPPDCFSDDTIEGIGSPSGLCKTCPNSQFGSASDGASQACKLTMLMFVVQKEGYLPVVVQAPPTSVKVFSKYLMKLTSNHYPITETITEITLEKAKSKGNIDYAKMSFKVLGRIDKESAIKIRELTSTILGSLEKTNVKTFNQESDPDYDESEVPE